MADSSTPTLRTTFGSSPGPSGPSPDFVLYENETARLDRTPFFPSPRDLLQLAQRGGLCLHWRGGRHHAHGLPGLHRRRERGPLPTGTGEWAPPALPAQLLEPCRGPGRVGSIGNEWGPVGDA